MEGPAQASTADTPPDLAPDPARTRPAPGHRRTNALHLAPLPRRYLPAAVLASVAVLAEICSPLLSGGALRTATMVAVAAFAASSLAHAGAEYGPAAAARVLAVAGGLGLAAEAIGVHTGFPFGRYGYTGTLGPQLAGVPLLVPLAWTMMAYPCLLLGRRLATGAMPAAGPRWAAVAGIGGGCLAGWDLYLDPQMVAQGRWRWAHPSPALPGVPGVPISNYLGWLTVAVLIVAAVNLVVPWRSPGVAGERVPAGLLTWTWVGSALANLAFFDRPAVAVYGGAAMGAAVVPYLRAVRRASPPAGTTREAG